MHLPLLPPAKTTIRTATVGNTEYTQLLSAEDHRQFYLLQNLSSVNSVRIGSTSRPEYGEILGPSVAKIVDISALTQIWAICTNPAAGQQAQVAVEEIIGYSPWQLRVLDALEGIWDELKEARKNGR